MHNVLIGCPVPAALLLSDCGDIKKENIQKVETSII